ncbi:cyclin-D-binding Myb-like transcription factor 1 [Lineus longissimus]|uniref:cyclin-D-binding Myb-like transcription factor 1 n=1 Tax=Lineus longissimus TaxID=88925 RepID=UPI00315C5F26
MDIVCRESNPKEAGNTRESEVTVAVIVDSAIPETTKGVNMETGNNVIVEPVNSAASIPATITDIALESVTGVGDIVQVMDEVTGAAVHTIQDVGGKFETIVTGGEAGTCLIQNVTVEAVDPGDSPVIKTETEECVNMVHVVEEDGCLRSTPVPIECAVEDVDNMKVHQVAIKILNTDQELPGNEITDDACLEPSAKRFCVEAADGQTYMVAMPSHIDGEAVAAMQGTTLAELQALHDPKQNVDVTQAWFTSRDDKTALSSKGQQWKQGQWSKDEVELLQANISNYCTGHGISDPTEIIFEMSKDERKDFYRTVAKGLQRPLFSVYRRVIRMYDQKNHVGKYTQEELSKLRELRAKHGTDWATIGTAMGRSASSVKDRCRLMKETCNSGKWLPEEEHRLTSAVYEQSQARPGESVTQGISWSAVAEKVLTRSEKQCRTKWLNYLNWKEKGGSEWTRDDDFALINRLASSEATDETQIDWIDLCKGWESVRSPQWLRGKWWSMKKHVQDYQLMSFQDIVQCLKLMQDNCLRGKLTGNNPAVRLRMNRMQRMDMVHVPMLHVPVSAVQGDLCDAGASATIIPTSEEDVATSNLQYEILTQQLTPTTSGAYLITQPQNNPAISFTSSNMATDHIIVHTLPTSHTLAQDQHPVIVSSTGAIHPDSIDLHSLTQAGHMAHQEEPDLDSQVEVSGHAEIIGVNENYEAQNISGVIVEEDSRTELDPPPVVESTDLVLVSSSSPHYAQSTSSNDGDLIHLSSLSDPMLPTDSVDLITSDVEAEKGQSHDVEDS